jgi:hypothetical protein
MGTVAWPEQARQAAVVRCNSSVNIALRSEMGAICFASIELRPLPP